MKRITETRAAEIYLIIRKVYKGQVTMPDVDFSKVFRGRKTIQVQELIMTLRRMIDFCNA